MRDRNLPLTGAIGLVALASMVAAGLSAGRLADLFGSREVSVEFAQAAGLKPGDPVRVSGVKVGSVGDISLDKRVVVVRLQVEDDVRLGDETRAELKIETLLGTEYVSLTSAGDGELSGEERIPVERTRTPFDLQGVLGGLSERVGDIDTDQLADAFRALSGTLDQASPEVAAALDGLTRLSRAVSQRDEELRELLARANDVSGVLADRSEMLVQLVRDAGTFLAVLEQRKAAIENLLVQSRRLARELVATARSTRADLAPALRALQTTIGTLRQNKGDLEESLQLYAPLLRYYTTVLGQGRWFDAALYGLTPKVLPGEQPGLEGGR